MSQKEFLLREALEIKQHLFCFLRHPLREIKRVPDWPWHRWIAVQVGVAILTGTLARIVEKKSTFAIIGGAIISPISTFITIFLTALFFYYCFQIFVKRTVSLRRMFGLVLFASLPWFIFQILEYHMPPITILSVTFAALLLFIGFMENFQLDRKMALKMVASLYAFIFALWLWGQVSSNSRWDRSWSNDRLDAPEVELGK